MDFQAVMKRAFLSQAVGDAFCYDFEFFKPSVDQVQAAWDSGKPIMISDDTQMALFGLYALMHASYDYPEAVLHDFVKPAYLAWYRTQRSPDAFSGNWLENDPLMRRVRAPGNTCMSSLSEIAKFGDCIKNNSKGDGAVMRTLPFVFAPNLIGVSPKTAKAIAREAGYLTHMHRESSEAVELYMTIANVLRLPQVQNRGDVLAALDMFFPDTIKPYTRVADVPGNTFTAMPCLVAAINAIRNALRNAFLTGESTDESFRKILFDICLCEGDSDTIAAIAGGLWGLVFEPPAQLVQRLVERDTILRVVQGASADGNLRSHLQVQPGSAPG